MKRIAVIGPIYTNLSQVQQIADRFLVGYPYRGSWRHPDMKVVSLYIHQKEEGDLSQERAREFGFQVFTSVEQALRCGGGKLAVDAVLIAAGHGDRPPNEFFQACVDVFEQEGRSVPVYNDMRLSSGFEKTAWMVDQSKRLRFPLLAGSPLPVTWRLPELELPIGCEIEEALTIGHGGPEPMDYDALEAMQCMIERRKGGETGIKSVQMLTGDAVWNAGKERRWSNTLLQSAFSRSDTPQGFSLEDGRPQDLAANGELPKLVKDPVAYLIQHNDGLKTTLLMLTGALQDFNFAARVRGAGVQSCQFLLTPVPNVTYSACLASHIEHMFETGKTPYPVERTLIVSGMLENCVMSRQQGGKRLETPHLSVKYQAPRNSVIPA